MDQDFLSVIGGFPLILDLLQRGVILEMSTVLDRKSFARGRITCVENDFLLFPELLRTREKSCSLAELATFT